MIVLAINRTNWLVASMLGQQISRQAVVDGIVWLGLFLAFAFASAWLMTVLWRRFITNDNAEKPDFTLEQLRQLRDRGELTQEQYDRLKEKAIDVMSTGIV